MANRVSQTLGPIIATPSNIKPTKMPTVQAPRCRCHKQHLANGHGPISDILQTNAVNLTGDSNNESIPPVPRSSSPRAPPPGSRPSPLSDTPRKLSSSNGIDGTRQMRRKERVGIEIGELTEELCSNCFFSSFFPGFQDDAHQEKMASLPLLIQHNFELTSPSTTPSSTRETWPSGPNERVYHSPITRLLNEIIDHFKEVIDPNHCNTVRFITYDKPMAPITPTSLKPDLLLVEEQFVKHVSLPWKVPIIPVEVRTDFWDALNQIGTYVREMLSARPGRQICWALYFDHAKSTFQVILFTPDRVHYTQPSTIKSAAGYREMVKVLLALLSQPQLLNIGEDLSRDGSTKLLPNGEKLEIQRIEFDRKPLVGRKTRVFSVLVVGKNGRGIEKTITEQEGSPTNIRRPENPPLSPNRAGFTQKTPVCPPSATAALSSSRKPRTRSGLATPERRGPMSSPSATSPPPSYPQSGPRPVVTSPDQNQPTSPVAFSDKPNLQESSSDSVVDYILKNLRENPDEEITFAGAHKNLEIGDHLVIKESWPLRSRRDVEWEALTACPQGFGLPEVVYRVTGKHPMPVACTREARVPQHIAMKEKGLRLQEASSPRALLTALLHATIGHHNLFYQGWLHRDVSIGNVLILSEPVTKLAPVGLEWLNSLTECSGILIDGDAMVHLDPDREQGKHRSCTPPFLSRRLVEAWSLGEETFDQYFDDLESFAWVLLWALLEIAETNKVATKSDRKLLEFLNKDDLDGLSSGKASIVATLARLTKDIALNPQEVRPTSLSDPFIIILDSWFKLTDEFHFRKHAESLPSSQDSTNFYKSLISVAMDKMTKLPEAWPIQEKSDGS